MRHKRKDTKLGRSSSHRKELLASLVCNLIEEKRIKTTLAKARLGRRFAEKMITLGKKGTLSARRLAIARLCKEKFVAKLFNDIVPEFKERSGGYTRIIKLGRRSGDSSEMALLEWVDIAPNPKKKKKKKQDKATVEK